jgi:hypothetical protein
VMIAVGLGFSMVVGAFVGVSMSLGTSHGPEESAWQLVRGATLGVAFGGLVFKLIQHRKSFGYPSDGPYGNC